jgi:hypothetical protein
LCSIVSRQITYSNASTEVLTLAELTHIDNLEARAVGASHRSPFGRDALVALVPAQPESPIAAERGTDRGGTPRRPQAVLRHGALPEAGRPAAAHDPLLSLPRDRPSDGEPFLPVEDGGHVRRGYSAEMLRELCQHTELHVEEISGCSGFASQMLSGLLLRLKPVPLRLRWPLTAWLRPLPPLVDRWLTHARLVILLDLPRGLQATLELGLSRGPAPEVSALVLAPAVWYCCQPIKSRRSPPRGPAHVPPQPRVSDQGGGLSFGVRRARGADRSGIM